MTRTQASKIAGRLPPPQVEAVFDPADHTVADVLAYVAEHPERRQAVYDSEVEGKARSTLLKSLEPPADAPTSP